jgi:phosphohistidine phosphatase SixA
MPANFNRLKRRPFLAPLLMPLVLLGVVVAVAIWLFDARTTSVVIVVRHAEMESATTPNPGLNPAGQQRAKALQQLLAQAKPGRGVDAIYVSEGAATQQTATPLAESMGLAVNVVPSATWSELPRTIGRDHAGEVVLVVATREAMQSLVTAMSGEKPSIDEQEYSAVFVISQSRLSKPAVVKLKY